MRQIVETLAVEEGSTGNCKQSGPKMDAFDGIYKLVFCMPRP